LDKLEQKRIDKERLKEELGLFNIILNLFDRFLIWKFRWRR